MNIGCEKKIFVIDETALKQVKCNFNPSSFYGYDSKIKFIIGKV